MLIFVVYNFIEDFLYTLKVHAWNPYVRLNTKYTTRSIIQHPKHYKVEEISFNMSNIKGYNWTIKNSEQVINPPNDVYMECYINPGSYVGFCNLSKITKIPNTGYMMLFPHVWSQMELTKYEYIHKINKYHLKTLGCNFVNKDQLKDIPTIKIHDWQDQNTYKVRLTAGDGLSHNWVNPSRFKHLLTNVKVNKKTTIYRQLFNNSSYAAESGQNHNLTTDGSLNVCSSPNFNIDAGKVDGVDKWKINQRNKKRLFCKDNKAENYSLVEVCNINSSYQ